MQDKLSVSERRTRILEYLALKKQTTRIELSLEFNVSICTIAPSIPNKVSKVVFTYYLNIGAIRITLLI
ncbi:MAG: hypothetical protein Q4G33_04870 [bacterium]|nr:hypothetical protein [bacterium]